MRSIVLSIFLSFFCTQFVFADAYVKSSAMNGMGEVEMWTADKMQKTSTQAPMVGEIIKITRADKGVEWEINPSLKAYSEKSITIEYKPETSQPADTEADKQFDKALNKSNDASTSSDCRSVKVSTEKTFAGMKAEGYQGICKSQEGESPSSTIWVATKGEHKAEQIQKQITKFEKSEFDARYSKYPAKERERTQKMLALMGTAMAQGLMGVPNPKDMPKDRMILGMGMAGAQASGGMMMEVISAEIVPKDDSRYEVPAGFTKVENLEELQSQQIISQLSNGDASMSGMVGELGKMAEKMGMPQDAETEALQNPQGMEEADALFKNTATGVKEEMQMQGAWQAPQTSVVGADAIKNGAPEPWQQGLYSSAPNQPINSAQPVYQTQNAPQAYYPQTNQPAPGYPPRRRANQTTDVNQALSQVQQIVGSMQGLTSQMGGGGMDMSSLGDLSGMAQDESYTEPEETDYQDGVEQYPY